MVSLRYIIFLSQWNSDPEEKDSGGFNARLSDIAVMKSDRNGHPEDFKRIS